MKKGGKLQHLKMDNFASVKLGQFLANILRIYKYIEYVLTFNNSNTEYCILLLQTYSPIIFNHFMSAQTEVGVGLGADFRRSTV